MTGDPLAVFFTVPIEVVRKVRDGAAGPVFAAPDKSLKARVRNSRKLVRNSDGQEVVSEAGVSLPIGTPTIPVNSLVKLPDGRTATVLAEERHDTGLLFMPNYYSIDLT